MNNFFARLFRWWCIRFLFAIFPQIIKLNNTGIQFGERWFLGRQTRNSACTSVVVASGTKIKNLYFELFILYSNIILSSHIKSPCVISTLSNIYAATISC